MSDQEQTAGQSLRLPMKGRDPNEVHRQASFLELFFDLCFVVAIAQAATQLHHALAENHIVSGILSYVTVFFSIWWAWMNFTWFASAYDNDDVPFRLGTMVQIVGALVLAAGVARGFEHQDFDVIFLGYALMRFGLASLWLRAAYHDVDCRTTDIRYAIGITAAMVGWSVMLVLDYWPLWGWWLMALIELSVPVWAEQAGKTPWHPGHIAERYGLFTIIVLGESVLAATNAVQAGIDEQGATGGVLFDTIGGGLLILFSLWWLYFSKPAEHFLNSNREAFVWGYGHYFIFASIAAVGAGLAVNVAHATGHTTIGDTIAAGTITIPVALFLGMLWLLHIRPHRAGSLYAVFYMAGALLVLATTLSTWPILFTGLITTLLVVISIWLSSRAHRKVS